VNFSAGVSVTSDYFSLVGKNTADSVRVQAWTEGVNEFTQSPLYGNGFTEALGAVVVHPGGRGEFQIPFHNDYVLFLAGGGILGLGLLIAFILSLNFTLVRAYRRFVAQDRGERASLVRLFMVCFNSFFVAAAFTHHAKKSGNLDQALHSLLSYPFGQVLLILIAAGIACYGLFCFARARHLSR